MSRCVKCVLEVKLLKLVSWNSVEIFDGVCVILFIGNNNANIVQCSSDSVRSGRWAERSDMELEYRITISSDGGFSQWMILRRDRLRKPRDLCPARFLVTSSTKYPHPGFSLAHSPSATPTHPPAPFRLDFLSRKWIFMKDVNNERDNFLFASYSCLQYKFFFSFSFSLYISQFPILNPLTTSFPFVSFCVHCLHFLRHRAGCDTSVLRVEKPQDRIFDLQKLQGMMFYLVS